METSPVYSNAFDDKGIGYSISVSYGLLSHTDLNHKCSPKYPVITTLITNHTQCEMADFNLQYTNTEKEINDTIIQPCNVGVVMTKCYSTASV